MAAVCQVLFLPMESLAVKRSDKISTHWGNRVNSAYGRKGIPGFIAGYYIPLWHRRHHSHIVVYFLHCLLQLFGSIKMPAQHDQIVTGESSYISIHGILYFFPEIPDITFVFFHYPIDIGYIEFISFL